MIDTHAHLYSEEFREILPGVIQRAKDVGVKKVLLPNVDEDSIPEMEKLVYLDPQFFVPMMGLHPCYVGENYKEQLSVIEQKLEKNKYCAVGEIGIDLYWDKSLIHQQKEAFRWQIQLAKKHQLPIVIHARDSFHEIFEILDEEITPTLKGVFHCFTGEVKEVEKILSYQNFYFGIGGIITYKKSTLPEVVKSIPLDKLLLETDAPYLAPVPYRGKTNESSYLIHIAEKIAEIKGKTVSDIAEITTANAKKMFGL